jgi:glycosyltransferase involved in cell wall biosynthesis
VADQATRLKNCYNERTGRMISVVLAVHNEEKNIERCLAAVQSFADEIILVDGESTDETVKLAKKLHARIISTTNKENFHINKQMAMDAAKGDLILQLDADEVVDEELAGFIQKVAAGEQAEIAAWWIKRRNWFLGRFLKKGGQYPDPVIRLYRQGKASLPQKDVHEQMVVDGKIGWAEGHLLHYGNPTFADYLRKWNTYTSFKAQQLKEAGVKVNLWNSYKYIKLMPLMTWFSLYIRHKGFMDGLAGWVFAAFSGLHHAAAYLKLWELYEKEKLGQGIS